MRVRALSIRKWMRRGFRDPNGSSSLASAPIWGASRSGKNPEILEADMVDGFARAMDPFTMYRGAFEGAPHRAISISRPMSSKVIQKFLLARRVF